MANNWARLTVYCHKPGLICQSASLGGVICKKAKCNMQVLIPLYYYYYTVSLPPVRGSGQCATPLRAQRLQARQQGETERRPGALSRSRAGVRLEGPSAEPKNRGHACEKAAQHAREHACKRAQAQVWTGPCRTRRSSATDELVTSAR